MNSRKEINYCAQCGKKLKLTYPVGDEIPAKYCPNCDNYYFGNFKFYAPAVCIIIAIINDKNQVLLKRNDISSEKYTLCSVYVEDGETLEEAVTRKVREETGCYVSKSEYVSSYYSASQSIIVPGFIVYVSEKYLSKEIGERLWVDLDRAADMILHVNNFSGKHLNNVIEKITGKDCFKGSVYAEYFAAFMDSHCRYGIWFKDDLIYDYHDSHNFNKVVEQVIKPEETYSGGYKFKKDNIYVNGWLDDCYGYSWTVEVKTEEELKKVLEWATAASEEFMKQKEKESEKK